VSGQDRPIPMVIITEKGEIMSESEQIEETFSDLKRMREITRTAVQKLISGCIPIQIMIQKKVLDMLPVFCFVGIQLPENVVISLVNDDTNLVVGLVIDENMATHTIRIPITDIIHICEKCDSIQSFNYPKEKSNG
jgi:hypothetical protein